MKKNIILSILITIIYFGNNSVLAQCNNGNVELGNFTNWTGYTGLFPDPDNLLTPGIVANFHTITSGTGLDAYGLFPIVNQGLHSIKIGYIPPAPANPDAKATMVSYSFVVTAANKNFQFKYALVLQDPGHLPAEQPDFTYYMKTETIPGLPTTGSSTSNVNLFSLTNKRIISDATNPFFKISPISSAIIYKSWECVKFDLTAWLGQTVTIFFKVRDCSLGQHWGYAYIDNLCSITPTHAVFTMPSTFCINNVNGNIFVDASASTGEDSYTWTVYGTDAAGGTMDPSSAATQSFYGLQAGQLDIRNWYEQHGHHFVCGQYYKIDLVTTNQCGSSDEFSKIIQFQCPITKTGSDKFLCCHQAPFAVQIGVNPGPPPSTFAWTSTPIGFSSTQATPTVSPTQSTTYHLTLTANNGCIGTADVNVLILQPFNLTIDYACLRNLTCNYGQCTPGVGLPDNSYPKPIPCDPTLKALISYTDCSPANAQFQALSNAKTTYHWNTGETTQEITVHPGITSYTVTATNGCFSKTATINNVIPGGYFSQPIPAIAAPSAILPNGTTTQQVCKIYEYGSNAPLFGTGPAYHAYRYRLRIFARGDNNAFYCKEVCNPCGFVNGEIQWDGRDNSGNLVAGGVYTAQLTLWNCNTPTTGLQGFPITRSTQQWVCDTWQWQWLGHGWIWPIKVCIAGHYVTINTYESSSTFSLIVQY